MKRIGRRIVRLMGWVVPCFVMAGSPAVYAKSGFEPTGLYHHYSSDGITFSHDHSGEMFFSMDSALDPVYRAIIKIDRYFGTEKEMETQVKCGLMKKTATLTVIHYDCDSDSLSAPMGCAPEVDQVYINGHPVARLTGKDTQPVREEFEVPVEYINFPKYRGDIAENYLEIEVDLANSSRDMWVLGGVKQSLTVAAPLPIMLVHGWTDNSAALQTLRRVITSTCGIPCETPDVDCDSSPVQNAKFLSNEVMAMMNSYRAPMINVMAHSKGGLDSRVLVDRNGCNNSFVCRLMQIATPNLGSHLANIVTTPDGVCMGYVSEVYGRQDKLAARMTPAVISLREDVAAQFNRRYNAPLCRIGTVIGKLGNSIFNADVNNKYYYSGRLSYGGYDKNNEDATTGDGIVSVRSAHAIGTKLNCSPLAARTRKDPVDHSAIVNAGAPRVLMAFGKSIDDVPEKSAIMHEVGSVLPGTVHEGGRSGNRLAAMRAPAPRGGMEDETPTETVPLPDNDGKSYVAPPVLADESEGAAQSHAPWRDAQPVYEQYSTMVLSEGRTALVELPLLHAAGAVVTVLGLPENATVTLLEPAGGEVVKLPYNELLPGIGAFAGVLPEEVPDGVYRLRCEVPSGASPEGRHEYAVSAVARYRQPAIGLQCRLMTPPVPGREIRLKARVDLLEDVNSEGRPQLVMKLRRLDERMQFAADFEPVSVEMTASEDGWYEGVITPGEPGDYCAVVAMDGVFNGVRQQRVNSMTAVSAEFSPEALGVGRDEAVPVTFSVDVDRMEKLRQTLNASLAFRTRASGEYSVLGTLYAPSGRKCGVASQRVKVESGADGEQTVPLTLKFPAEYLYSSGERGVFTLRELQISLRSGKTDLFETVWVDDEVFPTCELAMEEFAPRPLVFTGLTRDFMEGLTVDEEQAYERLVVEFGVRVTPGCAGKYVARAVLADSNGERICTASLPEFEVKEEAEVSALQTVQFRFDGTAIRGRGVDGPYTVKEIFFERQSKEEANMYISSSFKDMLRLRTWKVPGEYTLNGSYRARQFSWQLIRIDNTVSRWMSREVTAEKDGEYTVKVSYDYSASSDVLFNSGGIVLFPGCDPDEFEKWKREIDRYYLAMGVYYYDCYMFPPLKVKYDGTLGGEGITVLNADELTAQLVEQLPHIGNHDDILDIGEVIAFEFRVKCAEEDLKKWFPLVTISGRALYPLGRNYEPVEGMAMLHYADANCNYEVEPAEGETAIARWRSGILGSRTLLETIDLAGEGGYTFDRASGKFKVGRAFSLRDMID